MTEPGWIAAAASVPSIGIGLMLVGTFSWVNIIGAVLVIFSVLFIVVVFMLGIGEGIREAERAEQEDLSEPE